MKNHQLIPICKREKSLSVIYGKTERMADKAKGLKQQPDSGYCCLKKHRTGH